MSYDIRLNDPKTGEVIEFDEPHEMRGGTYAMGGTTEAWLNVTYNYGQHFRNVLGDKGIRTVYGLTGDQSIPILCAATSKLGNDTDPDYWKSTEGNAKKALKGMIKLALLAPHGVWTGD